MAESGEMGQGGKRRFVHDVLAALNVIQGFTELLQDGHAGELNATQLDYLQEIALAATQVRDLVREQLP